MTSRTIPVCTSVPGRGAMPVYNMCTEQELDLSMERAGHFYLTPEAAAQYNAIAKGAPRSKEEVDARVQGLATKTDLIPWSNSLKGCGDRLKVARDMVILGGTPKKYLGKIFSIIPYLYQPREKLWDYHEALTVGDYVIDPSLNTDRALLKEEWIRFQVQKTIQLDTLKIVDRGYVRASYCCCFPNRTLSFDHLRPFIFRTDPFTRLVNLDVYQGKVSIAVEVDLGWELPELHRESLVTLASHRQEFEPIPLSLSH